MIKHFAFIVTFITMYSASNAQTTKDLEKQLKSPQTIENSAKADLYVAPTKELEAPVSNVDKKSSKKNSFECRRKNRSK
jgi:hypothetical protein